METDTENAPVLRTFLRSLMDGGLGISQGLLVIMDGGMGLRAAVRKAFRKRALVQRCQWHKREKVVRFRKQPETTPGETAVYAIRRHISREQCGKELLRVRGLVVDWPFA